MLAAAQALDPEGDQHSAERGVGGQEDDGDREQGPGHGLGAQDLHARADLPRYVPDRGPAAPLVPGRPGRPDYGGPAAPLVAGRPGRHGDGGGGDQVAEGVCADQPSDAEQGQQDSAEWAADEPDRAVGHGVEGVGAIQQGAGAHDRGGAGQRGGTVEHAAGALGDQRGIQYPVPVGRGTEQHYRHGAGAEYARRDHEAAPVPPVGQDAGDRPEEQGRQVLHGEDEPGVAQGPGDHEDVGGEGEDQEPRAERTDQAADPQQPEVPVPQSLEHISGE